MTYDSETHAFEIRIQNDCQADSIFLRFALLNLSVLTIILLFRRSYFLPIVLFMTFSLPCPLFLPLPPSPYSHISRHIHNDRPWLLYLDTITRLHRPPPPRFPSSSSLLLVSLVDLVVVTGISSPISRLSSLDHNSLSLSLPLSPQRSPSSLKPHRHHDPSLCRSLDVCCRDYEHTPLQICREKIKSLQSKIQARAERSKLLVQRGTPVPEPLDNP